MLRGKYIFAEIRRSTQEHGFDLPSSYSYKCILIVSVRFPKFDTRY